jgi:membrane protein DedA with SNARE-associated domain
MTPLVNLPAATTTFASLGAYSSPMFDELLPIVLVFVGILIGSVIVYGLGRMITQAISGVFHH